MPLHRLKEKEKEKKNKTYIKLENKIK